MSRRNGRLFLLLLSLASCSKGETNRPVDAQPSSSLPADQRDAELLGREVFELVDRAIDYRGSHKGRPAVTFRQMGIDTLTNLTVRRLVNVDREPVITVAFRKADTREITSCRGDSQILEESSINGGRFTLMCTSRAGSQRPIRVGGSE
jgi:hypothetical protein